MAERVIHIAGMPIRVGDECRQRCAWCGAELIERHLDREAYAPGTDTPAQWYWEPDSLIEVVKTPGFTGETLIPRPENGKVPRGCCAAAPLKLEVVRG